jgi:anti-anti-sigma factor
MSVENQAYDDAASLHVLAGEELTIFTVGEWKNRLSVLLSQHQDIVLDLSLVCEIDTAGLQLLIWAKNSALAAGKSLRTVEYSPAVQNMLQICGLDRIFGSTDRFSGPDGLDR